MATLLQHAFVDFEIEKWTQLAIKGERQTQLAFNCLHSVGFPV